MRTRPARRSRCWARAFPRTRRCSSSSEPEVARELGPDLGGGNRAGPAARDGQLAADERYSPGRRAEMIGAENAPLAVEAGAVIFGDPDSRFTELVELVLDSVARMCPPR